MSLRQAGALIFGKTTTTEFATSKQGGWHQNFTQNVHDPKRTPGGSSSGSGAAVGDFQVPVALGTQTGGSIIRPASFNGCYGFKWVQDATISIKSMLILALQTELGRCIRRRHCSVE